MIASILITLNIALQLPQNLLPSICWVESNHKNVNVEDDGEENSTSYGICQIKLSTAQMFDADLTEDKLEIPEINGYFAGRYLQWQLKRYHGDLKKAISAYNCGSYCKANQDYVEKVLDRMKTEPWKKKSN